MKLKMTWKEFVLALYLGLTLPFILLFFFPPYICVLRATPIPELMEIQRQAAKATSDGKRFTNSDVGEFIKDYPRPFERIGYRAEIIGSGENWTIVVARKFSPSRFDTLFFGRLLLIKPMCFPPMIPAW